MSGIWRYFNGEPDAPCNRDRYTDRMRLVMALAEGFSREQQDAEISPEHALRGLASVDRGIGWDILMRQGVDLLELIYEVVQLKPKRATVYLEREPDGNLQEVLSEAKAAAADLGEDYVGTQHLVIGILRHDGSNASEFLKEKGASLERSLEIVSAIYGERN